MSASAAERIVLDGEVLTAQVRMLEQATQEFQSTVAPARAQIGGTAFGSLNGFLVGPINSLAASTAEFAAEAAQLAERMSAGVAAAARAFEQYETQTAAEFDGFEVES